MTSTPHRDDGSAHDDRWEAAVRADWAAARANLVEPPVWVTSRAKRLFRLRVARAEALSARPVGLLERIRATLVFDSRQAARVPPLGASAGTRAAPGRLADARRSGWQLLYRAADVDVDLLVRPNPGGHTVQVRGQALAVAPGPPLQRGSLDVWLARGTGATGGASRSVLTSTPLDAMGEFVLPPLAHGRYDLLLRLEGREVELGDVEL